MTLRVHLHPYALPFTAPVRTSRATRAVRRGWLVRVEDGDLVGWGEAACWPGFGAGVRATRRALRAAGAAPGVLRPALTAARALDLDALVVTLAALDAPEARHALELALLDLGARAAGVPLAAVLAPAPRASVAVQALVGSAAQARAAVARGATTLKLKVGAAPWPADLGVVDAVRAAAPAARLRVDANGAWTEAEAAARLRDLAARGVDLVEQPVAPGDLPALARVRAAGGARVAVDEGLRDLRDLEQVLALGAADAVVLKPPALGGVLAARAAARRAHAAGLEVVVTHAFDAAVGRAGALALAAGLPGDPTCGLAPALARDVADLPPLRAGRAPLPEGPGLGVDPAPVLGGAPCS